jgi:hypothetical protein
MMVTRRSTISGEVHTLDVTCTPEQLAAWEAGMLIQDAMPDVDAPLREFVKSGISPSEWLETFGPPPGTPRRKRPMNRRSAG